jgi:hypothetical protein
MERVRYILAAAALTTLFIGLATLLLPERAIGWFDGGGGESSHFVRFIGTALIGFSVMNWLYSRSDDLRYALPAIYGNLASLSLAIIVDAIGLARHELSLGAWIILGLHGVFAAAFAYCAVAINKGRRRI